MRNWIIKFDKKESFIIKLFRILGIIASLVCIFLSIINDVQYHLWVLPLTYSIGMVLLGNKNVVIFTPGIMVLNIVMFCRYVILPTVMCINGNDLSIYAVQYGYMNASIIVMWIELIGILISIFFTGIQYKKRNQENKFLRDDVYFQDIKYGDIFFVLWIIVIIIMIVRYPHLIGGIELLTKGFLSQTIDISNISGVVGIVWKSLTTWLGVYYIYMLKKKRIRGNSLSMLLILGIFIFVLISFIGQVTISRWYSVITFIAIYFSIIKMFPEKKKIITKMTIIPAMVALIIVSVYKNTDYLKVGEDIFTYVNELLNVSTLDSYFAGPVSVNNALYLKGNTTLGITSLGYDLLRNFPVLNHYINVKNATVEMYHAYLGRGDMILPLVGQSMIYFGYFFMPALSVCSVIFIRYFDYCYLKSTSLSMYIYAFTAAWLGLITILNLTICVSWFYSMIIPIFLLIRVIELTGSKKKRNTLLEG